MEIRYAVHPAHAKTLNTEAARDQFLIEGLFTPDGVKLVYSYDDRLIVGGICPLTPQKLEVDEKIIGAASL
jgi:4-deoxy-L-threo-5-hexosulose-uronate ketol-isomerase